MLKTIIVSAIVGAGLIARILWAAYRKQRNIPTNKAMLVTLPPEELMLPGLRAVAVLNDLDDLLPGLDKHFFPLLLKNAGKEIFDVGVVMILMRAYQEYSANQSAEDHGTLFVLLPQYLAVLITDPTAYKQALQVYKEGLLSLGLRDN